MNTLKYLAIVSATVLSLLATTPAEAREHHDRHHGHVYYRGDRPYYRGYFRPHYYSDAYY